MKIRSGFVSNSSSSSFIIDKTYLSEAQLVLIREHEFHAETDPMFEETHKLDSDCAWNIDERPKTINGWTNMDNFDMYLYLEMIGVNMDKVEWQDGYQI